MKRLLTAGIASGGLVLALTAGTTFASPASLLRPEPALLEQQPTPPSQPGTPTPAPKTGRIWRGGFDGGKGSLIRAAASVTGLTLEQVRTELGNGKSLAQIAQDKGKTANDVIQAARTEYQNTLNQAVANRRITQAQADAALTRFDQNASQIVNDTTLGQRLRGACPRDGANGATAPARRLGVVRFRV